jgi:hypothetical protein
MIKIGVIPITCIVASRTLSGKMIIGSVMARLAIGGVCRGMVECCVIPIAGVVAGGALPLKVICRTIPGVTSLTVGGSCRRVVKVCRSPTSCAMTLGTLPSKVVGRLIIIMASLAVCGAHRRMIESSITPAVCIVAL